VRLVIAVDLLSVLAAAVIGYAVRFGTPALDHLPLWVVVALPLA
jgi:hypothetical protein